MANEPLGYAPPDPGEGRGRDLPTIRLAFGATCADVTAYLLFAFGYIGALPMYARMIFGLILVGTGLAAWGLVSAIQGFRRCRKPGLIWDFAMIWNGLLLLFGSGCITMNVASRIW